MNIDSGTALQALVRGGVGQLLPGAAAHSGCCSLKTLVRITAGRMGYSRADMPEYAAVDSIADVAGQLLVWSSEAGLDGVALERMADARGWLLRGWQCKGGRSDLEGTGGKLATSLDKWAGTPAVGSLDDSTIHGIVLKGMAGMRQLLAALAASAPAVRLQSSVCLARSLWRHQDR